MTGESKMSNGDPCFPAFVHTRWDSSAMIWKEGIIFLIYSTPKLLLMQSITNYYNHGISAGLQLIREITSGKLFGDNIGSMSVTLHPSSVGCGTVIADTKTVG